MKKTISLLALLFACVGSSASAGPDEKNVEMFLATKEGAGASAGIVMISAGTNGLSFRLALSGMKPMFMHGFHIHTNASCAPAEKNGKLVPALGAGGHWDPENTGNHRGPSGGGHMGDLPRIEADVAGRIEGTISVPHLNDLNKLAGHALILHAGADNYADSPKKLGGGGARLFCGIID